MRTSPCSLANKVSFFGKRLGAICFIACFLLQKNLWARALELGSGIWTVMSFYLSYTSHLRNWAGGGGGCSGFRSSWCGTTVSWAGTRVIGASELPVALWPKIEPLSQWEPDGRRQPHLLATLAQNSVSTTDIWGHDEKCWHPALWENSLHAGGRARFVFWATQVWSGVSVPLGWEWGGSGCD